MTNKTRQEKNLLDHNPGTLSLQISDLCQEGWRVDPDRAMALWGFHWEVWMIRDATDEVIAEDAAKAGKPSRAEILRAAREAKAEKRAKEAAAGSEAQTESTEDAADGETQEAEAE